MVKIEILTCPTWGARKPKRPILVVRKASRVIFHHTAGHHSNVNGPGAMTTRAEAINYARSIQAFHMDGNGWIDSGHNFLVCRSGIIVQGRWLTVSAIEAGLMVESAHCPGYNGQIGIEHEHKGSEPMTVVQRHASARLQAWIAAQYGRATILPADPHSAHYATACPANLTSEIEPIRAIALQILKGDFEL